LTNYATLRALNEPNKLKDLAYEVLKKSFSDYINPKPSYLAERSKFRARVQGEKEQLSEYIAELQRLSEHCQFGDNLKNELRDQIAHGIHNIGLKKLFEEPELTFEKCRQIVNAWEATQRSLTSEKELSSINPTPSGSNTIKKIGNRGSYQHSFEQKNNNNTAVTYRDLVAPVAILITFFEIVRIRIMNVEFVLV